MTSKSPTSPLAFLGKGIGRPFFWSGALLVVAMNVSANAACTPNVENTGTLNGTLSATVDGDCVSNTGIVNVYGTGGSHYGVNIWNFSNIDFSNTGSINVTGSGQFLSGVVANGLGNEIKIGGEINITNSGANIQSSGNFLFWNAGGEGTGEVVGIFSQNLGRAIGSIINNGTLDISTSALYGAAYGITTFTIQSNGTLDEFGVAPLIENNGTLKSSSTHQDAVGILNDANLTTLKNNGSINAVTDAGYALGIVTNYRIGDLINKGEITATSNNGSALGISVLWDDYIGDTPRRGFVGAIETLENRGTVSAASNIGGAAGIFVFSPPANTAGLASINSITNYGSINASGNGWMSLESAYDERTFGFTGARAIFNAGIVGSLWNGSSGSISATSASTAIGISNSGTITTFENYGTLSGDASSSLGIGMLNGLWEGSRGTTNSILNAGGIYGTSTSGSAYGISNENGTIQTLNNSGIISGTSTNFKAYGLFNDSGTISSIRNTGTISGTSASISNIGGTITSLANAQGTSSGNSLSLVGNLPSNYAVILNSHSSYGRLSYYQGSVGIPSLTGLTFGIDQSSYVQPGIYMGVLSSRSSDFSASGTAFIGTPTLLSFDGITYTLTSNDGGITYNLHIQSIEMNQGSSKDLSKTNDATINGGTLVVDSAGTFNSSFKISNSGSNTIDANGKTATISGVISDATTAGNVTFSSSTNSGRVILSGNNTYTGTTEVTNGVVVSVNGSIASSSQLTVTNGGTIGGNGQLPKTSVGSGGTIAPGNSIGTLNVNGDLSFANGSTYTVELNSSGQADKIVAAGKVAIASNTNLSLVPDTGTYSPATIFTILSSGTGVFGSFSSVTSSIASLKPRLTYDGTNLLVRFVTSPSLANSIVALQSNSSLVRNVLNSRRSEITNTSGYDCETFDKNGTCLSFQARYSSWDNLNDGAGVLIGSYRLTDNIRLGAFADYRLSSSRLTNIKFSDDMPTVGGFIGYSTHTDGTGLNAKVSAALNTGNVSVTRDSSLANTEAGNGKTRLTSRQVSAEVSWGLRLSNSSTVSPFVGIRQSNASRGGYTEDTVAASVDFPITYNDYTQRSVTGSSGIRLKGSIFDRIGYQLALGVEHDINRQFTTYSGTSEIDGLTTFSLTNNGPSKRTRGFGSAGVHYQIEKNQRLTSNISLREQPYSSQVAVSVMSGYQMAF